MNIFYLSNNTKECAKQHIDKHVVKMILEYGQLMSTAHRVLDGEPYYGKTINNRNIQRWFLNDYREEIIWKASHVKHPSGLWVRSSSAHYYWLYYLWVDLLDEYEHRYSKVHSSVRMKDVFSTLPNNIPRLGWLCDPTPAMPDEYKSIDSVQSYRNYYMGSKKSFASWKNRTPPSWFI